ncbi:MAG: nitrous oxide reductase family maturation protein NosD [Promethearchaeota archaeon]
MVRRRVASSSGRTLVLLVLLLLSLCFISAAESPKSCGESPLAFPYSNMATSATPHAPIVITSNSDFVSQGWPGTGSIDDPFVIEGLLIRTREGSCIRVYRTDVYFVIRNCILDVEEVNNEGTRGVFLERVIHGRIENCNISMVTDGIRMLKSIECHVSGNTIDLTKIGIIVDRVYNCSITDNQVIGRTYGIYSLKSTLLTVADNYATKADIGILVEDTHDSLIQENQVTDSDWASYLYSCTDTEIMSNVFSGGQVGLDLEYSSSCLVSTNTIHHTGYGIYCYSSTDCVFTRNLLYGNTITAFYSGKSVMCVVTQNTIERNSGIGVHLQKSTDCRVYGNEIGWNTKGNGRDVAGTPLASSLNQWDDGVGVGNGWSDYDFGSTYSIPGDCNAVDMYPCAILAVIGPDVFDLEVGADGLLVWNASAIWPDFFEVRKEGAIVDSGVWDGRDIGVELIGLDMGTYQYSLFVNTTSGRTDTDIVKVVVADNTSPLWTVQPSDQLIELGERLDYSVLATDPLGIEKYWVNDTTNFNIDSTGRITDRDFLALGTFGLELRAYDPFDNFCTASIQIVVRDSVKPVFVEPSDITFVEGETAPDIVWEIDDLSPIEFEVLRDETLVASGHLSGGDYSIRVSVEDLVSGVYDFVLVLTDEGGNTVVDHVNVEVLESKATTTTTPTVTTTTSTTTTDTSTTTSDTSTTTTTLPLGDASMYILPLGIGVALAVVIISFFLQRRGMSR